MAKLKEQNGTVGQLNRVVSGSDMIPVQPVSDDRLIVLAKDLYIHAVNAGRNGQTENQHLAREALKQASAFWSVVDEQRPSL